MSGKGSTRRKETKAERANYEKSKLWVNMKDNRTELQCMARGCEGCSVCKKESKKVIGNKEK